MEKTSKYIIVSLKNRTIQNKENAKDVAAFMLGRRLSDWAVYQLQTDLPADTFALEKRLLTAETAKVD